MITTRETVFSDAINDDEILERKSHFIVVIFGKEEDLGKESEILEGGITVGRSAECNLVVNDPLVSRKHFRIWQYREEFYIEDLNSLNGTYVNQRRLEGKEKISDGSIITAGRTIFKFEARSQLESLFHQYLYTAATTDRMTGLLNKYYFVDQLKRQLSYAKRYEKQFVILMADLDNFKKINDTFGHQVGDEVLKYASFKILSSVRENDLCARYGGEEFVILLPETGIKEGMVVAERIRKSVNEDIIDVGSAEIRVSVSIGLSHFPSDSKNWEELIKIADKRLYEAKALGKNRVVGK